MKGSKFQRLLLAGSVAGVLGFMVINGCSSSGGGGSSGPLVLPSTLDEQSIQALTQQAVDLGSCTPVLGITSSSSEVYTPLAEESTSDVETRSYTIDEIINGINGGTLRKHGEHDSGTTTLDYDYDHFTNPIGDMDIGLTGTAVVVDHGKPSDYGPVMTNKTKATKGPISVVLESTSRALGNSFSVTLSGYNRIYAKTFGEADDLVIKNLTLVDDNNKSMVRSLDNVRAKIYVGDDQDTLTSLQAAYTDPESGTLKISLAENLVIDKDSMKFPRQIAGTFEMVATDGTKAEAVVSEAGSVKIYSVVGDVKTLVSEVNCSNLNH